MTLTSAFSPKWLIPLTLLTPYVFVLQYKISVAEIYVWSFLFLSFLPTVAERRVKLPKFILVFWFVITVGYLGALANGINWGVPIGIWNLNFFYKAALAIGAFFIGLQYKGEMSALYKSKPILITIIALGIIALVYPFLSFETKLEYFGIFYPEGSDFEKYLTDPKMPGLGLNANIYAFIVYSYLIFSFRAFVDGEIGFLVPLIAFLVILVLSSKLVIALSIATCAAQVLFSSLRLSTSRFRDSIKVAVRKRGIRIGGILVAALTAIVFAVTLTETGKRVMDSYATVKRFEAILSPPPGDAGPQGLTLRLQYWKKGFERAELAPILGIAKDPFRRKAGTLVGFYQPHNEYLRMWLLYGSAGLAAWIYLLGYMYYKNVRNNTDVEWRIFYGALAAFMMFDGGLDDPRVSVYLFLIFGLNWGQIRFARIRPVGVSRSPKGSYLAAPA